MTLYELLIFVHILAVTIWIGGALVGTLIGGKLRAMGELDPFAKFCQAFAGIAGPMFGGSAVLVLLTGIAMVARKGSPEFSDLWISVGFGGWLISTVMGATVVGGTWSKIGKALQEPGASLEKSADLIKRAVTLTWLDLLIRTAVVLVMVIRPT